VVDLYNFDMNMLEWVKTLLPGVTVGKRMPRKLISLPSYVKSAKESSSFERVDDLHPAGTDLTSFRAEASTKQSIRKMAKTNPDLSAAVSSAIRLAITKGYRIKAKNLDGTLNVEATRVANELCYRFDFFGQYGKGYSGQSSIRSLSESFGKELMEYGACSGELVLGPGVIPQRIQPVSTETLKFRREKGRLVPYQVIGSSEISLDYPDVLLYRT